MNATIALSFSAAMLFNLLAALADSPTSWLTVEPWRAVRLAVQVVLLLALLARVSMWAAAAIRLRRSSTRS